MILLTFQKQDTMSYTKDIKALGKGFLLFTFAAVALGFFASIGIFAAVQFLKLFGIKVL